MRMVPLEKLIIAQLVKKSPPPLWNCKVSHSFPDEPATEPHPKPAESSPHPYTLVSFRSILILAHPSIYAYVSLMLRTADSLYT
jgi:hypothetical protein